ncbi:hypothetical protein B0J15DRAFT_547114 [Fusarium solani]|uniref:F-box domain-containing protein n=1 Tax=Fusarium solani TaxID=169388 RepID=A0A9P9HVE1_FUSSL|nr:uncharacterized protein B0J15DRAFT_547114 [Fusarium solani]KAH7264355.1 hypothetical protein B0J15DRAFT_547114 [Fusarium solani]
MPPSPKHDVEKRIRLSDLPPKILYQVFSYISLDGGGFSLVCTSRRLHELFILELYKEAGRKSNWAPLFVGAVCGNIRTLMRCLEAGASLDYRWPGNDPKWWVLNLDEGDQPLHVAMMHYQVEAVEWILDQGISPYEIDKEGKIRTLELICDSQLLRGHYPRKLEVVARWRRKRIHIPDKDVLALRGRKIFDSLLKFGASHDQDLTRALEWKRESVEARPVEDELVEDKGHVPQSFLLRFPREILPLVLSHLSPADDGFNFVTTSRFFYRTLILHLYREAGRQLSWLPLFVGVMDGNLDTLEICHKVGAPMDHPWKGNHLTTEWPFLDGCRPLHIAIGHVRIDCVKWLIGKGANPSYTQEEALLRQQPSPLVLAGLFVVNPPLPRSIQVRRWNQKGVNVPFQLFLNKKCWDIFDTLVQAGADDAERFWVHGRGLVPGNLPHCKFRRSPRSYMFELRTASLDAQDWFITLLGLIQVP